MHLIFYAVAGVGSLFGLGFLFNSAGNAVEDAGTGIQRAAIGAALVLSAYTAAKKLKVL